jgi:hypothetical protein
MKYIRYYGCVECQRNHFEDEGLYRPHLMRQSKHGIQQMSVEHAAKIISLVLCKLCGRKEAKNAEYPYCLECMNTT